MVHTINTVPPTQSEVEEHMAFAAAALSLAGHEVTDPVLLDLLERAARHELTTEEAITLARRHVQG